MEMPTSMSRSRATMVFCVICEPWAPRSMIPTPETSRMVFSETVLSTKPKVSGASWEREVGNERLSTSDTDTVGPLSWALDPAVRRRSIAQTNELRVEHEIEGSVAGGVEGVLGDSDVGAGALGSLCSQLEVRACKKVRGASERRTIGVKNSVAPRSPSIYRSNLLLSLRSSNNDQRITSLRSTELNPPSIDMEVANLHPSALLAIGSNGGGEVSTVMPLVVLDGDSRPRVVLW